MQKKKDEAQEKPINSQEGYGVPSWLSLLSQMQAEQELKSIQKKIVQDYHLATKDYVDEQIRNHDLHVLLMESLTNGRSAIHSISKNQAFIVNVDDPHMTSEDLEKLQKAIDAACKERRPLVTSLQNLQVIPLSDQKAEEAPTQGEESQQHTHISDRLIRSLPTFAAVTGSPTIVEDKDEEANCATQLKSLPERLQALRKTKTISPERIQVLLQTCERILGTHGAFTGQTPLTQVTPKAQEDTQVKKQEIVETEKLPEREESETSLSFSFNRKKSKSLQSSPTFFGETAWGWLTGIGSVLVYLFLRWCVFFLWGV